MSTSPPTRLQPGDVIDGYRLKGHLHQGGMANLWDVEPVDGPAELPLIMKIPRIKGGDNPATIVGFDGRADGDAAASGPARATLDRPRRLHASALHRDGAHRRPHPAPAAGSAPLPFDEVARIGHHVAVALHELHKQHLVHLDVKPSNVVFRPSGEAVLIDFGLSHHEQLPDLLEEEFTLPMGTGPYISPEQVQFIRNDPRSDLFALGVMLYHLTTGKRPFGNPTTVSGLRKRLYTAPIPPRQHRADTPPWLQEVILRCLEVDPRARTRAVHSSRWIWSTPSRWC